MSKKSFLTLCAVTAIAVVLAVVAVLSGPRVRTSVQDNQPLFPNLIKNVDELKSVVIHHGGETTSLDWDGKMWRYRERANYPADGAKITNLVVTLARMTKLEPKTKQSDRYDRLELEDPNGKEAKSQQVMLIDRNGKELANVIIGKTRAMLGNQDGGTYIRFPADPQTWLARGELSPGKSAADWLQREIVDIKDVAIKTVRVTPPNGEKIVVFKADPTDRIYSVENLPKGMATPPNPLAADAYARVLANFTFDDVVPAASKTFPKEKTTTAVFEGFTGFKVNLDFMTEGDEAWVKLQGQAPPQRATPAAPEGVHVTDLRNDWDKTIADLNAKADGWVFRVPAFQVEALTRRMSDLLKKPEAAPSGVPQGFSQGRPPGG